MLPIDNTIHSRPIHLAQMTPACHYSRDALKKVAALVDELATMVKGLCSSIAVVEAISQKLTVQTTVTKNESTHQTFNTTTDIRETKTDVIAESTSPITDINNHDKTMAPFLTASTSSMTKIEKEVDTQSQTPERVWFSPLNRPLPLNSPKFVILDPP
nr:hypothetical protein [Tanacetum cinerariifolium]